MYCYDPYTEVCYYNSTLLLAGLVYPSIQTLIIVYFYYVLKAYATLPDGYQQI